MDTGYGTGPAVWCLGWVSVSFLIRFQAADHAKNLFIPRGPYIMQELKGSLVPIRSKISEIMVRL